MLPKFDPKSFINALEKYKPTFLHLAPPLLAFCADHEGVRPDALKQMHHVMTAAAPTGATLVKRFQKKVPGCLVKEGTLSAYICDRNSSQYRPENFKKSRPKNS